MTLPQSQLIRILQTRFAGARSGWIRQGNTSALVSGRASDDEAPRHLLDGASSTALGANHAPEDPPDHPGPVNHPRALHNGTAGPSAFSGRAQGLLSPGSGADESPDRSPGAMGMTRNHRSLPHITRNYVSEPQYPITQVMPQPNVGKHAPRPSMSGEEAHLFRHYIQHIAICLDTCDPLRNFELVVPQRIGTYPILLKATFAIAARHLSRTSEYDPLASNRYHNQCLTQLIPMIDDAAGGLSDENLFAATIILRMLEEMDAITGNESHGHLLGIHAFVNIGDQYMVPGSLSAAAYWAGLRQEIYSAIISQSRVKINLDHFIVDRSLQPADDYTWSNRAVVNLADVLNYCFDAPPSPEQWAALDEHCRRWEELRPSSFEPFFYQERQIPDAFPQSWHHSSCHITGIQYHLLAQLFLAQFDPTIPRVGTKRTSAMKKVTQRIDELMRRLCGIGASNQWAPPAMFEASTGIAMFGDRFEERVDQEAMLDILRRTESDHARPTKAVQQQLTRAWGWMPSYEEN
ncbi:hypothetical protein PG997_014490 [Apiospora hydei]|uniref:Uncharacterized protein n=1 Tax=Apiospora hydei TaxID=1337664 RepID=A0ABR1UTZ1_9PEZI